MWLTHTHIQAPSAYQHMHTRTLRAKPIFTFYGHKLWCYRFCYLSLSLYLKCVWRISMCALHRVRRFSNKCIACTLCVFDYWIHFVAVCFRLFTIVDIYIYRFINFLWSTFKIRNFFRYSSQFIWMIDSFRLIYPMVFFYNFETNAWSKFISMLGYYI